MKLPRNIEAVTDIETVSAISGEMFEQLRASLKPDARLKDPKKIEADLAKQTEQIRPKGALSPLTGQVASIATVFVTFDNDGSEVFRHEWATTIGHAGSEVAVLEAWIEKMDKCRAAIDGDLRLVTYNGRRFDVPFLIARQAVNNLSGHKILSANRYDKAHIDLIDQFEGGLGKWALLLGMEKLGKGSDVAAMIEAGDWDAVRLYNMRDSGVTAELWRRAQRSASW